MLILAIIFTWNIARPNSRAAPFFLKISWPQSPDLNRWLDWQVAKLRWKVKGHPIHLHLLQLWKTFNCSWLLQSITRKQPIRHPVSGQFTTGPHPTETSYCSDVTNQLHQCKSYYSELLQWCESHTPTNTCRHLPRCFISACLRAG